MPEWLKYWFPQSWSWFTTPSGSEPVSDRWIVKFIRKCQAPIIAHPLGAVVAFVYFRFLIGCPDNRINFWGVIGIMFVWQLLVWEMNNSVVYPPREIIWRMILGTIALVPLVLIF